MTITAADKKALYREIRIGVLSAMETGNHDRARTIIQEFLVVDKPSAEALQADVQEAYGIRI